MAERAVDRLMPLPAGVEGWFAVFAHDFLASFDAENRADFLTDMSWQDKTALWRPNRRRVADQVRLCFAAVKP